MKTLGEIYGTGGTILSGSSDFSGYEDRVDQIVKCPECDQAAALTDFLLSLIHI